MKLIQSTLAVLFLAVSFGSFAVDKNDHSITERIGEHYDTAKVIKVKPLFRKTRVLTPIRECWDEPVVRSSGGYSQPKSAGGMAVGSIIGGVIGHQVGKGRGNKLATALGVIIGAGIGHDAVNGHFRSNQRHRYTEYEEQCEVRHQVSYDEVIDGYNVTYRYQGERYQVEMPHHPGNRLKLRISVMY